MIVRAIIFLMKILYVVVSLLLLPAELIRVGLYKVIMNYEAKKMLARLSKMLGKEVTIDDLKNFHKES